MNWGWGGRNSYSGVGSAAGEWVEAARPRLVGSWELAVGQGDSVPTGRAGWGWLSWGVRQEAGRSKWSFSPVPSLCDFPLFL